MSEKDDFLDYVGYVLSEEEVKKWNSLKTDEEREEFNKALRQKKENLMNDIMNDWVRDFDKQVIESIMIEGKR